ncbi:MAG: hypothetical protein A3E37_05390 [Candidatus Andersenbacteria bacterium RIFCSPHIGHO2_12_FULL_46_9]|nr:MAG: hypothetical protein UW94_C0002G0022 [Parcubacteria group bacterium GW2011_GWA2_45_14]OGY33549.1 MAG: hypothetical protein A3B76_05875 [Candidatus Andersenbacteria bacterium RIFCSPHIGHO2_02_FULL_46_16]OGY35686.1 MAG: hypothetical protein A3E37_05390 [Candidatus Andersenbacteria bacterium RIFCSPHIGHO2_12_FULL_46_9]OGY38877.1 MAG: hypothetical protein A3G57_02195 [Candidatus Andersenbacteria bacterium RIFCSPLOWO2_12_FULL_45_8]HBE89958.1 hypothetical protein [Candidatus Andersenbacteria ba
MIKYRYNLIKDLKNHIDVLMSLRELKKLPVTIHYPNPWETLKLIFIRPKIDYQCDKDITCYWKSAGTGGSYFPPDEIYVCPRETSYTVEEIVKHEIIHLEHEHEVQGMTHEEKEAYIISKENS